VNVVDSSGWLEFFADGPNAGHFGEPLADAGQLLVPTVTLYEVFKVVLRQRDETCALQAVALMRQGQLLDLSEELALAAAKLGSETGLPMADSIILASARSNQATLWTQDEHFRGMEGVRYYEVKQV
jgi:predicted nucleic acid-binding protein